MADTPTPEVVAFLLGEGPLDGVWFGEAPPAGKPAFWWRTALRAALREQEAAPMPTMDESPAQRLVPAKPTPEMEQAFRLHYEHAGTPGGRRRLYFRDAWDAAISVAPAPAKLWLWKNFVDGKPEYWAFDNPYPINLHDGDPQTLGEPCGYAIFKPSRQGRTQAKATPTATEFDAELSRALMDLADKFAERLTKADPRAWSHLLVYAPEPQYSSDNINECPHAEIAQALTDGKTVQYRDREGGDGMGWHTWPSRWGIPPLDKHTMWRVLGCPTISQLNKETP